MKRFLRFASALVLLASCSNPYRHLRVADNATPPLRYSPEFRKELYRCTVNGKVLFKRFHLSGLLFFKTFEDGSTRAVFQNEMGFSFFDFRWSKSDSFQVMSIIPQLDKPALVSTLHKDMNLVLRKELPAVPSGTYTRDSETYYRFPLRKGVAYYITSSNKLTRIENAGRRKVITIDIGDLQSGKQLPGALFFRHHKAHFTIDLKKIIQDAG